MTTFASWSGRRSGADDDVSPSTSDEPDHAVRAAGAALALQRELTALAEANPGWPRLRVGVNSGVAVVRKMGGDGSVTDAVGDTINTASQLESHAPEGDVLIGAETRRALPDDSVVEAMTQLRVKGKQEAVDAYLLHALPRSGRAGAGRPGRHGWCSL